MNNKTLIITGSFCLKENNVAYDVYLFGQSDEHTKCIAIHNIRMEMSGYDSLIDMAKEIYSRRFNTHSEDLTIITDYLVNLTYYNLLN